MGVTEYKSLTNAILTDTTLIKKRKESWMNKKGRKLREISF